MHRRGWSIVLAICALPPYTTSLVTIDPAIRRGSEATLALASVRLVSDPQPGDRSPAPGALGLVQAFMNSRWDLGCPDLNRDQFETAEGLARWLSARGLLEAGTSLTAAQRQRALDVRDGLQALAFVNNGSAVDSEPVVRLNRALRGAALFVQLDPSTPPDFRAERRNFDAALALIGTVAALAQLDGRWSRLKACRGRLCGWAFYDQSRNQAGNWCAMATCGSRTKARQYRSRKGRSPASSA